MCKKKQPKNICETAKKHSTKKSRKTCERIKEDNGWLREINNPQEIASVLFQLQTRWL